MNCSECLKCTDASGLSFDFVMWDNNFFDVQVEMKLVFGGTLQFIKSVLVVNVFSVGGAGMCTKHLEPL